MNSTLAIIDRYKPRRKLPFVKYITYQGHDIVKGGTTIIDVYISADVSGISPQLEISQSGSVYLDYNPASVGYFTKRKAVELFGALLEIVEQKGLRIEKL